MSDILFIDKIGQNSKIFPVVPPQWFISFQVVYQKTYCFDPQKMQPTPHKGGIHFILQILSPAKSKSGDNICHGSDSHLNLRCTLLKLWLNFWRNLKLLSTNKVFLRNISSRIQLFDEKYKIKQRKYFSVCFFHVSVLSIIKK